MFYDRQPQPLDMKHLGKPLKEIIVEPLVMPEPLRKEEPIHGPQVDVPEAEPAKVGTENDI